MATPKLEKIRNSKCRMCDLHYSSKNVCIMGKGNPTAKIMLVGEAPGEEESKTGIPFMGIAGQLLDRIIEQAGLTGQVYITNVAKCHPPGNRKPSESEAKTCASRYLTQELQTIKPKVVVCLGKTAIEWCFQRGSFKRTVPVQMPSYIAIATWHPSYANRLGGENSKNGRDIIQQIADSLMIAKEIVNGSE